MHALPRQHASHSDKKPYQSPRRKIAAAARSHTKGGRSAARASEPRESARASLSPARPPKYSRVHPGRWGGATHLSPTSFDTSFDSNRPPPISLVYDTAELIGVDVCA